MVSSDMVVLTCCWKQCFGMLCELAKASKHQKACIFKHFIFLRQTSALPTPTLLTMIYHNIYHRSNHYALMTENRHSPPQRGGPLTVGVIDICFRRGALMFAFEAVADMVELGGSLPSLLFFLLPSAPANPPSSTLSAASCE